MGTASTDVAGREISNIIPVTGVRKIIGQRMRESLDRSPQGTGMVRADMSHLIAFRDELVANGQRISYVDLFVKITGLVLEEHPIFNSSLQDGKIIVYKSINIGVAVFIDETLFVPVIKNVQGKTLFEVSSEMKGIIQKIKNKQFSDVALSGSTFTVNNMGMLEVDAFTPFINPPEAAILGIGKTRKEVVVGEDDSVVIRPMTTLCLTNDHAITDGVPVGRFFSSMKKIMENPKEYLL